MWTFAIFDAILAKRGCVMETTVDRFGRVLIPKTLRKDIGLEPGVVLHIEKEDGKILLEPLTGEPRLVEKQGVLVFTGAATGDIEAAVKSHREARIAKSGLPA
jgi:AbrB family looped-hinge helix DNA binding protein